MEITVNQKKYILDDSCCVQQMLALILSTSPKGIAVAINQTIISKPDWNSHVLKHGDQVMLIKATQGG